MRDYTARYFEELYKTKHYDPHPYHSAVKENIGKFKSDISHDDLQYNLPPTRQEIAEILESKKNGKSTTDMKNEMVKRPGEPMTKLIHGMICKIWEEEQIPDSWNKGNVTCIYKGKGDKEKLINQRGITTSSTYGSIMETLLDKRIERVVPYTQAQGGGVRGTSTCDHLFLLKTIIDIANKDKRQLYLTFYDVSKAYDNVDNADMLSIMWEKGLKGKVWRILMNLNSDLKASIKTKHGQTREILMEVGGRQGSCLTGRMFSKMMDILAEEMKDNNEGFKLDDLLTIAVLLWVDDVVSCTEGKVNQTRMLNAINEFAQKHKLKWGKHKCKVLKIGKHKKEINEWKIGDMVIDESPSYSYLGDEITCDGKNTKNLETRKNKLQTSTININTIASNDILTKVETTTLLELHEKISIPSLTNNAESWNLNISEAKEIEKIEVQALKSLFSLPLHTPTAAVIYSLGTLYTKIRIDQKQLIYVHKVLNRDPANWTKIALNLLQKRDMGWFKNISDILHLYGLPTDLSTIKNIPTCIWKRQVKKAIEHMNSKRLKDDCYKTENGTLIEKTKTKHILNHISNPQYQRKPSPEILQLSKTETKSLIIARFKRLECGKNFKGSMSESCTQCNTIDNEDHRLNHCIKWRSTNFYDKTDKVDFSQINSDNVSIIRNLLNKIGQVWNVTDSNGTMH